MFKRGNSRDNEKVAANNAIEKLPQTAHLIIKQIMNTPEC